MKKKICDHPAGILIAIIVAFLIVFLNYYTIGNLFQGTVLAVAIVLFYVVFCLLCKNKENNENDKDL
jgi:undecaprenyl pyrophosphate phosphatase UppP